MNRTAVGAASLLMCAAGIVTACAPTVQVTELTGAFEPRRSVEDVAVFTTLTPDCPYREIAIVNAFEANSPFSDLDDVLAAMKEKARGVGADAVVGVRLVDRGGESTRKGYSGTAIRFEDEDCMH
jgi:hypothetical protein